MVCREVCNWTCVWRWTSSKKIRFERQLWVGVSNQAPGIHNPLHTTGSWVYLYLNIPVIRLLEVWTACFTVLTDLCGCNRLFCTVSGGLLLFLNIITWLIPGYLLFLTLFCFLSALLVGINLTVPRFVSDNCFNSCSGMQPEIPLYIVVLVAPYM